MQKMTANSPADLVRMAAKLGATGPAIHLIFFTITPLSFHGTQSSTRPSRRY